MISALSDGRARMALCAGLLLVAIASVRAQASSGNSPANDLAQLSRDVEREQAIRDVKNLEVAYVQYSQFGLWSQMASLFAKNGEALYGADDIKGSTAIAAYMLKSFGGGHEGLPPGALHTQFDLAPVVNLSDDGRSAKARWRELSLLGQYGRSASWAGGILENEYIKEDGVWKISRLHYHPILEGSYEDGWRNVDADQKIVPYHYTSAQVGAPVPALAPGADLPALKGTMAENLHALNLRIAAMNDEDRVRNLQNIYGYYVDQKMWDDVTDLFTSDSVLEVAGVGLYRGPKGVRKYFDSIGPSGLRHGELNDHMQLDALVEIAPDGLQAHIRGLEWAMLGDADKGTAYWGLAIYDNRFVKLNAVWHIREMRIFPVMKANYYQGWGKSSIVDSPPKAPFAPDLPTPAADVAPGVIPEFLTNPVTGKSVDYPVGAKIGSQESLLPTWIQIAPVDDRDVSLAEARRRFALSVAYDGVDNVVNAFGYTIDDHRWNSLVSLFAERGAREEPFSGFYIGHDHISEAETVEWGPDPDSLAVVPPRTIIRSHYRLQPVINVNPDGHSATIRTRLLLVPSGRDSNPGFDAGMYPGDELVLENGTWKLWNVAIDEPYWSSAGYKGGWAKVKDRPAPASPRRNVLLDKYPPDILLTDLGEREIGFGGGPGPSVDWPSIKPMWFSYRNPVSGRTPPHYWPTCATCVARPDTSLKANGF